MCIRDRFVRDLLENTAFTKVQTSRVFVRDGERFARVTPSEFASLTDEALSPAPDAPRDPVINQNENDVTVL